MTRTRATTRLLAAASAIAILSVIGAAHTQRAMAQDAPSSSSPVSLPGPGTQEVVDAVNQVLTAQQIEEEPSIVSDRFVLPEGWEKRDYVIDVERVEGLIVRKPVAGRLGALVSKKEIKNLTVDEGGRLQGGLVGIVAGGSVEKLVNRGEIVSVGGKVKDQRSGAIFVRRGLREFENYGLIEGHDYGVFARRSVAGDVGVQNFVNHGTIRGRNEYAFVIERGSRLINHSGGKIEAPKAGVLILRSLDELINHGKIVLSAESEAGNDSVPKRFAVEIRGLMGELTNTGTIEGYGGVQIGRRVAVDEYDEFGRGLDVQIESAPQLLRDRISSLIGHATDEGLEAGRNLPFQEKKKELNAIARSAGEYYSSLLRQWNPNLTTVNEKALEAPKIHEKHIAAELDRVGGLIEGIDARRKEIRDSIVRVWSPELLEQKEYYEGDRDRERKTILGFNEKRYVSAGIGSLYGFVVRRLYDLDNALSEERNKALSYAELLSELKEFDSSPGSDLSEEKALEFASKLDEIESFKVQDKALKEQDDAIKDDQRKAEAVAKEIASIEDSIKFFKAELKRVEDILEKGTELTIDNSGKIIATEGPDGFAIDINGPGKDTITLRKGSVIVGQISWDGKGDTLNYKMDKSAVLAFAGQRREEARVPQGVPDVDAELHRFTVNSGGKPVIWVPTETASNKPANEQGDDLTTNKEIVKKAAVVIVDPTAFSLANDTLFDLTAAISGAINAQAAAARAPRKAGSVKDEPLGDARRSNKAWGEAFGSIRNMERDGPRLGAKNTFGGVVTGFDLGLGGLFLGGSYGQLDVDDSSQTVETTSFFGGPYFNYVGNGFAFNAMLGVGYADHESKRTVNTNKTKTGRESATASYDGWFVAPEITATATGGVIEPSLTLGYAGMWQGAYKEKSKTGFGLNVADRDFHLLTARAQIAIPLTALDGRALWKFHVGAEGWMSLGDDTVSGSVRKTAFTFKSGGEDGVVTGFVGGSLAYEVSSNFHVGGNFELGYGSDKSTSASAQINGRLKF